MSRKRNCHDNFIMKNFFGFLKDEIYYGVVYYSYEELKNQIEKYIKYCNEQRRKEKLGCPHKNSIAANLTATLKKSNFLGHLISQVLFYTRKLQPIKLSNPHNNISTTSGIFFIRFNSTTITTNKTVNSNVPVSPMLHSNIIC